MPIRLRLALVFATAAMLLLAVSGWLLVHLLEHELNGSLDATLAQGAPVIAHVLAKHEIRHPDTASPASRAKSSSDSHLRYVGRYGLLLGQVLSAKGAVIAALPATTTSTKPLLNGAELAQTRAHRLYLDVTVPGSNGPFRLLAESDPADPGAALVIGASIGVSVELEHRLLVGLLIVLVPVGVLAGLGAWLLAEAALRPVERLRREAASISTHDTGARLAVPNTADEVAALGQTMDELLARLQGALQHQRAFVSDAGHELRTPLAALEAELELASRPGRSPAELSAAISNAGSDAKQLQSLIENLLVLARSDEHELQLQRRWTPLGKLVADAVRSASIQGADRHVTIESDLPSDLGASVDPLRLRQVLDNLLSNSLRFAPDGSAVTLRARVAMQSVVLEVDDEGPGFPVDFLPVAFERFNRPDQARDRGHGGSGLGLAIVKAIVEAHEGSVSVENRLPKGARVSITLPA
ncbi:MAG: ATP-binding protein [Actinomycetota bacterium]|nr:ATP-binding protein [Actinomycetota bacterium]